MRITDKSGVVRQFRRYLRYYEQLVKAHLWMRREFGAPSAAKRETARTMLKHLAPRPSRHGFLRLGDPHDGGYVVPDDLDGIVACFSPGVGPVTGFDNDMSARGVPCFLADASVEAPLGLAANMKFEKLFLGGSSGNGVVTLSDWVNSHSPGDGDLILQMDIEGAEYTVLEHAPDALLARFRVIVVELHDLKCSVDPEFARRVSRILERLAGMFDLVHLHPNNFEVPHHYAGMRLPPVLEATYLRKDRNAGAHAAPVFPRKEDSPCSRARPDWRLTPFWR